MEWIACGLCHQQTDLLPDEHGRDDQAVQTEEAVQDVAQLGVVQRQHGVCG